MFSAAYAELAGLAAFEMVPRPLLLAAALVWPFHVVCWLIALRAGPGFEQARWLQRRYRILFAVVGVVMAYFLARGR